MLVKLGMNDLGAIERHKGSEESLKRAPNFRLVRSTLTRR
jgi:hypothetical protein